MRQKKIGEVFFTDKKKRVCSSCGKPNLSASKTTPVAQKEKDAVQKESAPKEMAPAGVSCVLCGFSENKVDYKFCKKCGKPPGAKSTKSSVIESAIESEIEEKPKKAAPKEASKDAAAKETVKEVVKEVIKEVIKVVFLKLVAWFFFLLC